MNLHETIKNARKSVKISQQQVSKSTGISTDRLTGIEAGEGKLSLTELQDYLQSIGHVAIIIPDSQLP